MPQSPVLQILLIKKYHQIMFKSKSACYGGRMAPCNVLFIDYIIWIIFTDALTCRHYCNVVAGLRVGGNCNFRYS